MNVIISNKQEEQITALDIDIIKSITGSYNAGEIVEMFKNFFYSKMVLDVTSINNYDDINSYKLISEGLDPEKIVFFIPEGSSICTPSFLAKLVKLGIYNFTTNIEGVKYLLKKSNTYNDVVHIEKMGAPTVAEPITNPINSSEKEKTNNKQQPLVTTEIQQVSLAKTKIIGIKNVTEHAGATSLTYMLKKELSSLFGEHKVLAVEVDKNDFIYFNDETMISTTSGGLKNTINQNVERSIILIDLNEYEDDGICDDVLYLVESSTLKLNKLMRKNSKIFSLLKDKKVILNKSLLSAKDVSELEYEAHTKFYFCLPPIDDRKKNEVIIELLMKLSLIQTSESTTTSSSEKVFGLFRR